MVKKDSQLCAKAFSLSLCQAEKGKKEGTHKPLLLNIIISFIKWYGIQRKTLFGAEVLTLSSLKILISIFEEWKLLGSCSKFFFFFLSGLIPKARITGLSTLERDCTRIYNS